MLDTSGAKNPSNECEIWIFIGEISFMLTLEVRELRWRNSPEKIAFFFVIYQVAGDMTNLSHYDSPDYKELTKRDVL